MANQIETIDPAIPPDTSEHGPSDLEAAQDAIVVKCTALTKIFRDFWFRNRVRAVDGVNLEVRRGEVFGLLGPNGSGKSTTIKMMLGLLYPTSGRIMVFGKRPDDVAIKRQIGYLPEESYLYRFLNARETLDYYGRLFHQNRSQRRHRIDMLLKMVGLDAVQRRPVGEYSKGMQRRIGLAQALINDPQLLILDEPTTGLDPLGTRQIKDLILTLKQRGKTILLCSHLLADVEDVCDRVAVMYGGKIQRQSAVDDLLTHQNMTTISTEKLDAATIEEIDQLLMRKGKHIEKVEQPRRKLEALFLDIVHEAQSRGAATNGAVDGGQIAAFLADEGREAHQPESVEAAELINSLLKEGEQPPAESPEPDAPPTADSPPSQGGARGGDPNAEPKQVISDLVQSGAHQDSTSDAPEDASGTDTTSADPAYSGQKQESSEKPNQQFIDALLDVPEYEQYDDQPKQDSDQPKQDSDQPKQDDSKGNG